MALPSGPSSDKKYRSPFSFKRGDSHNMQIPEDPPERPDTAITSQDSYNETARQPSESYEREDRARFSPSPPPQSTPDTNGFVSQGAATAAGLTGVTNEVYSS